MRTLDTIRAELDRELRRLAQAYLYGTPAERQRCHFTIKELAAEQQRCQLAVQQVAAEVQTARQRWVATRAAGDALLGG